MTDPTKVSKLLSFVLRHEPSFAQVTPDSAGWVEIAMLLDGLKRKGTDVSQAELLQIVETSDKKRFSISDDGLRIRCNQGHSIEVSLGYETREPPEILYHGTAIRFLDSIRLAGLTRQARHHVHLSDSLETAGIVGKRHGKPAVLEISAGKMSRNGFQFFLSENGVWLTDSVPASFIKFPD